MITQQELLERFEYRDGELYRKTSRGNRTAGTKVGCIDDKGYIKTEIDNTHQVVHRLIFMMHHGYMPEMVDHVNGVRTDNRIENLRAANPYENSRNSRIAKTNKCGVKNVYWHPHSKCWLVRVMAKGKNHCVGYFKDLEAAELVAQLAREKYHGEFARHI
jgi:hypothetical protein